MAPSSFPAQDCGVARHHAGRKSHCGGSAKFGEQLLISLCENDVSNGTVRKRAVVEVVTWWHWLRAVRRMVQRLDEPRKRCILVSGLSTILKGIANNKALGVEYRAFAEAAAATSSRPHCVTGNTSGSVKMALLCNDFLDELLSTVLLNHVQHEAVVRGPSED